MNRKIQNEDTTSLTLKEIRDLLQEVEEKRTDPAISNEERILLEESALSLKAAERAAILDIEQQIIDNFENQCNETLLQSKNIRELVTKLNRLPKVLNTTESVIKECVRVLTLIANLTMALILVLFVSGCATMNKAQLERINTLAFSCDSISATPTAIFSNLSEIRHERSLMYVASLTDTDNRIKELNAIAAFEQKEEKSAAKAVLYSKVLDSYVKALQSLSSPTRWRQSGVELRSLGRNTDSLITAYNALGWGEPIEFDHSVQVAKTGGYITENIYKRRQYKLVKEMIENCDTIVSSCCNALIAILKDDNIKTLIDNEESGLETDYKSYLNAMSLAGKIPDQLYDRKYLALKAKITETKHIKTKCINNLHTFRKAHNRVLQEMQKKATYSEFYDDISKLTSQYISIKEIVDTYQHEK
ncbi:MAG: hypothetical protein J6Q19_06735 [Bacteroidaceae bacterium]|nr:hypothetical protein [Bacteroidaceae bacterium]